MKFFKKLRFRFFKSEKTPKSTIVIIIFAFLAVLCAGAAVYCRTTLEKDYESGVHKGVRTVEFTEFMSLHVLNVPLNIYPSKDNKIHIDYSCDSDIDIYEDNGRLYLEQEPSFVITLLCPERYDFHVDVYLPKRHYTNVEIETNSGSIDVNFDFDCYMMKLKTKSGTVRTKGITSDGTLAIKSEQADVSTALDRIHTANIDCSGGVTSVELRCDANLAVRPDSLVYLNGIAAESTELTEENKNNGTLHLSSLGGRIRITKK